MTLDDAASQRQHASDIADAMSEIDGELRQGVPLLAVAILESLALFVETFPVEPGTNPLLLRARLALEIQRMAAKIEREATP